MRDGSTSSNDNVQFSLNIEMLCGIISTHNNETWYFRAKGLQSQLVFPLRCRVAIGKVCRWARVEHPVDAEGRPMVRLVAIQADAGHWVYQICGGARVRNLYVLTHSWPRSNWLPDIPARGQNMYIRSYEISLKSITKPPNKQTLPHKTKRRRHRPPRK